MCIYYTYIINLFLRYSIILFGTFTLSNFLSLSCAECYFPIRVARHRYPISTARRDVNADNRNNLLETQHEADKTRSNGVRTPATKCSLGTVRDSPRSAITSRTFCPLLLPLHLRFRRERDTRAQCREAFAVPYLNTKTL